MNADIRSTKNIIIKATISKEKLASVISNSLRVVLGFLKWQ